jgi:hypothetical protein
LIQITIYQLDYLTHMRNLFETLCFMQEEESGAAIIKVWDCDRTDKQGLPISVRVSRIFPTTKSATVTALCVHEHQNLLALGFSDGTIILHRGKKRMKL